jgi:hypothetical protein
LLDERQLACVAEIDEDVRVGDDVRGLVASFKARAIGLRPSRSPGP